MRDKIKFIKELAESMNTNKIDTVKYEENDFEILRTVLARIKHPLIAEGNIDTPEKVKRVLELGAYSVVVGSAITRPQLITKKFVDAIQQVEKD